MEAGRQGRQARQAGPPAGLNRVDRLAWRLGSYGVVVMSTWAGPLIATRPPLDVVVAAATLVAGAVLDEAGTVVVDGA